MLRVGIAGIGSIARVYLGLFAAGKIPGGRVTALSSRNMVHLTGARDAFCTPGTALFTDYEALLHSGLVDVVMICTPHNRHVPMALQALKAGVRYRLVISQQARFNCPSAPLSASCFAC